MKEFIKSVLKDHVIDNKLDQFGTLFVAFFLASCISAYTTELKLEFNDLGIKADNKKNNKKKEGVLNE